MTRTYTVKCTVQISTQNTAQSFTASLAKWLSVRLRTKGSGFESSCSHLILGVETKHYGYLLASIILEKLHLSKIKLLIDVKIRSSHRQMFCREGVFVFWSFIRSKNGQHFLYVQDHKHFPRFQNLIFSPREISSLKTARFPSCCNYCCEKQIIFEHFYCFSNFFFFIGTYVMLQRTSQLFQTISLC